MKTTDVREIRVCELLDKNHLSFYKIIAAKIGGSN